MDALSKAPKLRQIGIHIGDATKFSPSQMEQLLQLPHLEELGFRNVLLDSATWEEMAKSDRLTRLVCEGVPLTDDDLQQLASLKSLQSLSCFSTKLTPAGVARFRAARPEVQIETDVPKLDPAMR